MIVISSLTQRILALSMLKGVGPAALKRIVAIPGFQVLEIEELALKLPPIARALEAESAWSKAVDESYKQLDEAERHRARIISPLDSDYPRSLAETKDDPFLLYVKGHLAPRPEQSVAIIGTREPTVHGEHIAARIAHFFVEQQWSVVSGLAIGCDGIAHAATLAAGGHTVAVLAHGLHMVAPARHRNLAEQILESGGALVSEYPFGRNIQNSQYVKRDRTQAGMAQGVVMIQSDIKGGSLHASRASLDYKRWLAVPYPTKKDLESRQPKVQANLLISDGTDAQRAELLHCNLTALERIIVLRGKEDYARMLPSGQAIDKASEDSVESTGDSRHYFEGLIQPSPSENFAEYADADQFNTDNLSNFVLANVELKDIDNISQTYLFQNLFASPLYRLHVDISDYGVTILPMPSVSDAVLTNIAAPINAQGFFCALGVRIDKLNSSIFDLRLLAKKNDRQGFLLLFEQMAAQFLRVADLLLVAEFLLDRKKISDANNTLFEDGDSFKIPAIADLRHADFSLFDNLSDIHTLFSGDIIALDLGIEEIKSLTKSTSNKNVDVTLDNYIDVEILLGELISGLNNITLRISDTL